MVEENIMLKQKDSKRKRSGLGLVGSLLLIGATGIITVAGTTVGLETNNPVGDFVHSYSPVMAGYRIESVAEPVQVSEQAPEDSIYLQRAQALETALTNNSSGGLGQVLDQYVCDTWSEESGTPRRFDVSPTAFLYGMIGDEGLSYLEDKKSLGSVNSELTDIFGSGFGSDQGQLYGWENKDCTGVGGGE